MDYWAAIRQLQLEKQRLDKAIATLEALSPDGRVKAYPVEAVRTCVPRNAKKVSERMKRYWALAAANHSRS